VSVLKLFVLKHRPWQFRINLQVYSEIHERITYLSLRRTEGSQPHSQRDNFLNSKNLFSIKEKTQKPPTAGPAARRKEIRTRVVHLYQKTKLQIKIGKPIEKLIF